MHYNELPHHTLSECDDDCPNHYYMRNKADFSPSWIPEDNNVRTVDITKEPPFILDMPDTWF